MGSGIAMPIPANEVITRDPFNFQDSVPLKTSGFMCSLLSVLYLKVDKCVCLLSHLTLMECLLGACSWAVVHSALPQ